MRSFKYDPPAADFKLLHDEGFYPARELIFPGIPGGDSQIAYDPLRAILTATDPPELPGQAHAEWCSLLDALPEELRQYQIAFLGTTWRHTKDGDAITYLYYAGGSWNLGVRYTAFGFHGGFRFAAYNLLVS